MPTLYLIRHCSAAGQEPDAPLTEDGHAQSLWLRDFFSELTIDRIISSDYTRAVASVTPLADAHHLSIEREPLLRERILSHEPLEDWLTPLRQSFSDPTFKLPGAESAMEATQRILQVVEHAKASHASTLLVTHGNLLALLLQHLNPQYECETWRKMRNPDVYRLDYHDSTPVIEHIWPNK
ncbi:Phosphoglycerate mutase [Exiguobacterium sp. 8H]|uniref:histidine phosphatase family protein n=1 Tax=unclassified Exiguobacterium TaxID=2644629 RepID=UPI0012F397B0|nr:MULTISPECIES: histidine phosphatase family protein [unclassified Exiguobacterium]VXB88968.1 Phosphoglycerate mutase [Exiguobacterium sp. 8H]VXC08623.1 Phosphoglycerate mutase [Exiguobacterium sp. 8A]